MSDFNEQLKKRADSIKLKAAEKRELRERVIAYMEYHPLPAHLTEKKKRAVPSPFTRGLSSEPFSVLSFNTRYFQSAFVLGALFLVVGVPSLAERSLPGDVLYPMKVLVNEEVRSTLAFSPYEKVEWEAARLERRLAEARLLAQAGKLTEAVEREVAAAVKKHSDSAQETILTLRESNTEEAALAEIAFTSVLAAQADIITIHEEQAKLALASNEEVAAPTMLASAVREAHSAALSTGQSPVTPAGMFGLIERETTYAAELFSSVEAGATEQDAKNIERRLADIGRKVARAQTLNASLAEMGDSDSAISAEQGSSTEGGSAMMATTMMMEAPSMQAATSEEVVAILKAALTDTRKLISFMTDIEVRGSVDVEALVPLTPTDEERVAEVVASITTARATLSDVARRTVDADQVEKVARGTADLEAAILRAELSLQSGALVEAEAVSAELEAYVEDLRGLVADSPLLPITDETASSTEPTVPTSTTPATPADATTSIPVV